MGWLKGFSKKQNAAKGFQGQKSSSVTFILEPILTPSGIIDTDDHSHDLVLDVDTPTLPEVHLAETNPIDATDTSHATSVETDSVSQVDLNSHPLTEPTHPDLLATHSVDDSISDSDLDQLAFFDPTDTTNHSQSVAETTDIHPTTVNETHDTDIIHATDISDPTSDEVSHPLNQETSTTENHTITDASSDSDGEIGDVKVNHDRTTTEIAIASPTSEHSITDTTSHPIEQHIESADTTNTHSITDNVTEKLPETTATDNTHSTTDDVTDNLPPTTDIPPIESSHRTDFSSGVFTVGETGKVEVDFLFDGGGYKGELAIFSLKDMENLTPGSSEFIKEAATRALSDSEFGHIVISDITEGAKFSGELSGEDNQNSGFYGGAKPFKMNAGDEFGVMLVPNGTLQQIFENPNAGGSLRPLFSMVTANPNDQFHIGQIADVTGDGNTFVMEDLRVDTGSDRDYNDIIFQVRGATGKAIHLDEVIDTAKDWRGSDMGQALIAYAEPYVTPDVSENVDLGDNGIIEIPWDELDGYPEDGDYFDDGGIGFEDGDYFNDDGIVFEDGAYFDNGNIVPENIEYLDNNAITFSPDAQILDVTESGIDTSTNILVDNLVSNIPAIEDTQVTETAIAPDTTHTATETEKVINVSPVETHPVTETAIAPDTTHSTTGTEKVINVSPVETHPVTETAIAPDTTHSATETEKVINVSPVETHSVTENAIAPDTTHTATETKKVINVSPVETHPVTENAIASDTTHSTTETEKVINVSPVETHPVTENAIAPDTTSPTPTSNVTTAVPSTPSATNQTVVETSPITVDRTSATSATEVISTTEVETSAPITATNSATVTNSNETEIFAEQPPVKATVPKPPTSFDFPKANQPLVGVIDTGFSDNNPDLDYSRITLGKDFVDGDDNPLLQSGEGSEHGTHILGIIAAQKDNDIGIDGINDDAPIWVGRAIGSGKWADSLVEFVDAAKESGQPNAVVNLSLDLTQINPDGSVTTRYEFTPQERAAIEYARQNNVLIVVAAGNDGGVMSALGQSSQEFDNIITVGAAERVNDSVAVSKAFDRADYSSYGYGLDIMADGGNVDNQVLSTTGDGVGTMAGTSVASAKVTGAASQVWAANPNLSYRQVIEILKDTATDLKTTGWDAETGAGFLNMTAAVLLAKVTTPEVYDPENISIPTTWGGEGNVTPGERAVATEFLGKYYEWDSYTIKSGDTLGAIALRTMGSSSSNYVNFIAQKNSIANVNLIYAGQKILIPRQVSAPVNLNNTVGYDGTSTIQSYIDAFNRNGGKTILGSPTNNVHSWQSGYTQDFSGGSEGKGAIMKANGSTNSYWVGSDFWSKFLEVGGAGGILRYPTSDRYSTNSGWRQNFQGGAILKSAKGIFPVFGGIGAHYLNSENGEKGRLGFPISGEIHLGNGVVIQNFENGRIVYGDGPTHTEMNSQPPNPITSVTINGYTVNGNFYSVFKNYQAALGNPISGVVNHANSVTEQLFQNGSIISSKYGTFPLYGGIRQTYLNNSGLNGWLGAPTSAEVPQGNGVVKQTFEGGYIIWNGKTATAYRTSTNNPVQPITSTPAPASVQNIVLKPSGSSLSFSRGQQWVTSTGYKFSFQQDGNLVLYNPQGKAIWATGTNGTTADRFSVQTDGNVVLYAHGKAVWATNTAGNPGASFAIQNDGNLVVYSSKGKPLFDTGTYGGRTGTFTASPDWLKKNGNGGGSGKYYPELASLTKANWNYQSKDNLFFDGKPGNGESLSAVKQVYSDLSKGIFGSYKAMTAGYFDNTNYSGKHYGIDMAGLAGNSVKTVVGGTTTLVQNIAGNYFIGVKGDDGNLWIYGHLENYSVGIGKRVEAGTKIGTIFDGAYFNGNWMNQHLHLEVHQGHTYNRTKSISPLEAYWKLRNK